MGSNRWFLKSLLMCIICFLITLLSETFKLTTDRSIGAPANIKDTVNILNKGNKGFLR